MGLFAKKEEVQAQPEAKVEQKVSSNGTVVCEGMTLVGNFETDEQLDIKGVVKGDIFSSVDTHVSKTGKHIGKMKVNTLHVDGSLESDVQCAELAYLSPTANFKGTLETVNLDAAHGSNFNGTLNLVSALKSDKLEKLEVESLE